MTVKPTDVNPSDTEAPAAPAPKPRSGWGGLLDQVYGHRPRSPNSVPPDEARSGSIPLSNQENQRRK